MVATATAAPRRYARGQMKRKRNKTAPFVRNTNAGLFIDSEDLKLFSIRLPAKTVTRVSATVILSRGRVPENISYYYVCTQCARPSPCDATAAAVAKTIFRIKSAARAFRPKSRIMPNILLYCPGPPPQIRVHFHTYISPRVLRTPTRVIKLPKHESLQRLIYIIILMQRVCCVCTRGHQRAYYTKGDVILIIYTYSASTLQYNAIIISEQTTQQR